MQRAVLENIVLPNCENICIPWMLAEKEDWVPSNVAPFIWINQELRNETSTSSNTNKQSSGGVEARSKASASTSTNGQANKHQKPKKSESSQESTSKSSDSLALPTSSSGSHTLESSSRLEELTIPLLENEQPQDTKGLKEPLLQNDNQLETSENNENNSEILSPHGGMVVVEKQNHTFNHEDGLPKKMGRKERMLGLGKKMGEKLEEKRRHIEEKSRHIVEKMRGP